MITFNKQHLPLKVNELLNLFKDLPLSIVLDFNDYNNGFIKCYLDRNTRIVFSLSRAKIHLTDEVKTTLIDYDIKELTLHNIAYKIRNFSELNRINKREQLLLKNNLFAKDKEGTFFISYFNGQLNEKIILTQNNDENVKWIDAGI